MIYDGTAYLVAPSRLQAVWSKYEAEERLSVEKNDGYAFFRIKAKAPASVRATFFETEFGTRLIKRGRLSPAGLLFKLLSERGLCFATAESCTGGLIAGSLTEIPGSSKVFWGGVTVYSNGAKEALCGVDARLLQTRGAVSGETVTAMARGILEKSRADVSLAVSGIAGPDGGSKEKPVGTVWLCAVMRGESEVTRRFQFQGGRNQVRGKAFAAGVILLESLLLRPEKP